MMTLKIANELRDEGILVFGVKPSGIWEQELIDSAQNFPVSLEF